MMQIGWRCIQLIIPIKNIQLKTSKVAESKQTEKSGVLGQGKEKMLHKRAAHFLLSHPSKKPKAGQWSKTTGNPWQQLHRPLTRWQCGAVHDLGKAAVSRRNF